jgi:hypothetical protein
MIPKIYKWVLLFFAAMVIAYSSQGQTVTVTSPNGGELLTSCQVHNITWTYTGMPSGSWSIDYSTNNGSSWIAIVYNYATFVGTYNWVVPNFQSSTCLIRVRDASNATVNDQSNGFFTINVPMQLVTPNGGEAWVPLTVHNIVWSGAGPSNYYDIDYSINGGINWTNIVTNQQILTGFYSWTVPNTPSTNCKVRVKDHTQNCVQAQSAATFTIIGPAPTITVLTPNGNNNLSGCQTYNITWSETSPIGTYNFDYSTDGGITWVNIATGYATTSLTYAWNVPNLNSATVLVRVASTSNATVFDLSNAYFGITPIAVVATPPTATICAGSTVQLNATGVPTYSWTPITNLSCSSCANPIASPTTSTDYVVEYTNGTCTVKDTVAITVNAVPAAPTAGSNSPLTVGGSIILTASTVSGGSYSWTGPIGFTSTAQNPTITNAIMPMSGTYQVTVAVNGCVSAAGATTVMVTPSAVSGPPVVLSGNGSVGNNGNPSTSRIIVANETWEMASQSGKFTPSGNAGAGAAGDAVVLLQNFPNPFSGETTIRFALPEARQVQFAVSDLQGRVVRTFGGVFAAGVHDLVWDGRDTAGVALASGTYVLKMDAGVGLKAIRMVK